MKVKLLFLFLFFSSLNVFSQTKILFEANKAQSAGNADWVIDSDLNNLGFSNGSGISGTGSESNPQRIPTLNQSGITSGTLETYWKGGLSAWAIDCVKQGYIVETLPNNGLITYGNSSNPQDLSNYKVYVTDEPNISYTALEKDAIINFVSNGGGLLMISDHDVSDRNGDGVDSPTILNDLMLNNTVHSNPFGINFNLLSISPNSTNIANLPTNTILHGNSGNVSQVIWSAGTSMTLNTNNNASVRGLIYTNGSSNTGIINVLCAQATYNLGKVVAFGDSSIADDGTGDTGDTLYDGYYTDANGNHQKLLVNAIIWLAGSNLSTNDFSDSNLNFSVNPNPIDDNVLKINFNESYSEPISLEVIDTLGRIIESEIINATNYENSKNINLNNLNSGLYFCKLSSLSFSQTRSFIIK
ncbi:MAG: T9SS type A sorting domain-containing protein [Flavobacterium sp.]|nr:T9SS type A sorting domain-containing protein [Flavobacterium sp.]